MSHLTQIASLKFVPVPTGTVFRLSDGDELEVQGSGALAATSENQALLYLVNDNNLFLLAVHAPGKNTLLGQFELKEIF